MGDAYDDHQWNVLLREAETWKVWTLMCYNTQSDINHLKNEFDKNIKVEMMSMWRIKCHRRTLKPLLIFISVRVKILIENYGNVTNSASLWHNVLMDGLL